MMFIVRNRVSFKSLNLRCTSINQSTRIALILSFMSVCFFIYPELAYDSISVSFILLWISSANSLTSYMFLIFARSNFGIFWYISLSHLLRNIYCFYITGISGNFSFDARFELEALTNGWLYLPLAEDASLIYGVLSFPA